MSRKGKCEIWGTIATLKDPNGDGSTIQSSRTAGCYFISGSAISVIANYPPEMKVLLTDWLVEQRQLGVSCPKIITTTLKTISNAKRPTVHQRMINLLEYLIVDNRQVGTVILFHSNEHSDQYELLAWTSSQKFTELITLVEYCVESGYIEHKKLGFVEVISKNSNEQTMKNIGDRHEIMLKAKGHALLETLKSTNENSTNCFVAM